MRVVKAGRNVHTRHCASVVRKKANKTSKEHVRGKPGGLRVLSGDLFCPGGGVGESSYPTPFGSWLAPFRLSRAGGSSWGPDGFWRALEGFNNNRKGI